MHLATYIKEPKRDCNSFFEHTLFVNHWRHNSLTPLDFSEGIETEQPFVLTKTPRHMTGVELY